MSAPLLLDPALYWTLRASLSALLLSAAAHKLRDLRAFDAAVAAYELVPRRGGPAIARLIVASELGVTVGLWLTSAAAPALIAAMLLTTYTAAIAINLVRGRRDIDCGCAGPAGRMPIGPELLVRNLILIAASLASALPVVSRQIRWLDTLTIVGGTAVLAMLYAAANTAVAYGTGPHWRPVGAEAGDRP